MRPQKSSSRNSIAALYVLVAMFVSGCASSERTEPADELLASVSLQDGVDKVEADHIAQEYFRQNVGCGYFREITDGGDSWVVEGAFGYSAAPIKGFLINKRTGAIKSPIGPSYASPFEMSSEAE